MIKQQPALQQTTDRGPWPGPRPYSEADRDRFFGRGDDQYELLERLDAGRLVLLTSPSAIGKTSFVRASVVPELRRRRRQALDRGERSVHPTVIVVRDWGVPGLADTDSFFIEAVREGIEQLKADAESYANEDRQFILQDHTALAEVEPGTSAYQYIVHLAESTGKLTLVLDQFEEALQGSRRHIFQVSELIGRLYSTREAQGVRLLLSFRKEFLSEFAGVAQYVEDLNRHTYQLQPLKRKAVREALTDSAEAGSVELTEDALDELMRWMKEANTRDDNQRTASSRATRGRRTPGSSMTSESSVDLLKLQALLLQLYQIARRRDGERAHMAITMETLDRLRGETDPSGQHEVDGADVVEQALERFIDSLLPIPSGIETTGLPPDWNWNEADEDARARNQALRWRRAAARMGPNFSSGGFKVQQEQSSLLSLAWREEWEALGISVEDAGDILEEEGASLDLESLSHLKSILESKSDYIDVPRGLQAVSGIAKKEGWDIGTTAIDIIATSLKTLEILEDGNVLRRKSPQDHVTYELVHDGFGDAFADWAEESRAQPVDALTATTAERGTAFRWARLNGTVRDMCWHGCWVGPDPDKGKRLCIENVVFENCDLHGTVFDRCDFVGGGFRDCNLGGAVFWDCTFKGTEDEPFLFDDIRASGLSFDDESTLEHVRFGGYSRLHNMSWTRVKMNDVLLDHCIVNQLTIRAVTLEGSLSLNESWILLGDLVGLETENGSIEDLLNIHNCDLFYCRLDAAADRVADRDDTNVTYPEAHDIENEPDLRNVPDGVHPWLQPL